MNTNFPLDITALPFSRRGAKCMVFYEENGEKLGAENGLYLSQCVEGTLMGGAQFLRNKNYLLITPLREGEPVPYSYTATPSRITLTAAGGRVDMTFSPDGALLISARSLSLRMTARFGFADAAVSLGRCAQVDMDGATFYMVPEKGSIEVDSHYELESYRYSDPVIHIHPENGEILLAIYEKSYRFEEDPVLETSFEASAGRLRDDFAAFASVLPEPQTGMEHLVYSLWIGEKPLGEDLAYPSNPITATYPRAAEQPFLSLAFKDAARAASILTSFKKHLTPRGLVPEYVLRNKKLYQTVSMDFGYAALELLKKDGLSQQDAAGVYDFLCAVDGWWTENRSSDGGVSFFYAYPFECGDPRSSVVLKGAPATTPDLMTRMVLSAKALAAYAEKLGLEEAAAGWKDKAQKRQKYLMDALWDGEKFVGRLPDGTVYESGSLLACLPILLGEALEKTVVSAITLKLIKRFLIPNRGHAAEAGADTVDTALSALVAMGLWDAGEYDTARRVYEAMAVFARQHGVHAQYGAGPAPEKRCGALYPSAACAALLTAWRKISQSEV